MASKTEQLRDTLLKAIDAVRDGTLSVDKAKAMATLAHQVTASLNVELQVLLAANAVPAAARLAGRDVVEVEDQPAPPAAHAAPAPAVDVVDALPPAPWPHAPAQHTRTGVVERGAGVTRHTMRG